MKFVFVITCLISSLSFAQKVNVKDIDAKDDSSTTIEIRKGDKAIKTEPLWEVVEGNADINGEHQAARTEARTQWKKACDTWKKEIRDDNKENKIITLNCGTPSCLSETEGTACKSQANYKIKTRLN